MSHGRKLRLRKGKSSKRKISGKLTQKQQQMSVCGVNTRVTAAHSVITLLTSRRHNRERWEASCDHPPAAAQLPPAG